MIEKIITMIERRNQESNILSTQPDDLNAKINKLKTEINITKALIDIDNQEKQVVPREKLG
jgi:outer membrane murein-binding lipoprotein Lpp